MKSFAIDLYIWVEDLDDWMLVPTSDSSLCWPASPGISKAVLLSSTAGVTFRVDDVLWLGNERDGFPLRMVVDHLSNTIGTVSPGELLARFADTDFLSVEIRRSADGEDVLVSRTNTRQDSIGYLEQTARCVGSYYENFPIERTLWEAAVAALLRGLAIALIECPIPGPDPEDERWARWLLKHYGPESLPNID